MIEELAGAPSDKLIRALLAEVAPGSTLRAIETLPGSCSNSTHLVRAHSRDGSSLRLVVRRYRVFGSYDRGEKARREFKAFELARRHGIPAPLPIYLDDQGAVLGTPGIVTDYVEGAQVTLPSNQRLGPGRWQRCWRESIRFPAGRGPRASCWTRTRRPAGFCVPRQCRTI